MSERKQTQKEKDFSKFKSHLRYMAARLPSGSQVSTDLVRELFWTSEEIHCVKKAEAVCHPESIGGSSQYFSTDMCIPEDMPAPDDDIKAPSISFFLRPMRHRLMPVADVREIRKGADQNAVAEFKGRVNEAFRRSYERALFCYIADLCFSLRDWNTVRHLFPGMLYVLRDNGQDEIANKYENIKTVPHKMLATITPTERKIFRYVNEWMARYIMLDAFHKPNPSVPAEYCTLSVSTGVVDLGGVRLSL